MSVKSENYRTEIGQYLHPVGRIAFEHGKLGGGTGGDGGRLRHQIPVCIQHADLGGAGAVGVVGDSLVVEAAVQNQKFPGFKLDRRPVGGVFHPAPLDGEEQTVHRVHIENNLVGCDHHGCGEYNGQQQRDDLAAAEQAQGIFGPRGGRNAPGLAHLLQGLLTGGEMDPVTAFTIDKGQKNTQLLIQPQYSPMPVEKQIAILYCATKGLLRDVPLNKVHEFENSFLESLQVNHQHDVLDVLKQGTINDEITTILEETAQQITASYKK